MKVTDIVTKENPFARDQNGVGGATVIEAPEFTHRNPRRIIPFLASLRIEYVPRQLILVGDSVGEYLVSFRDVEMEPEEAIRRVTGELAEACEPMVLNVSSNYAPRHGIAVNPQGRYMHPEAKQAQQGPRIIHN